jgi:valyl-tRNA synthetase
MFCAENEKLAKETALAHYGEEKELTRDADALDTWFSSALWPFATLDYNMD